MSSGSPSDSRGLAELFELATPDIYHRNAFRVLGLRVDSDTGDARRRKKKLKQRKALGLSGKPSGSILPLSASVGPDELQQAQDRIQNPVSRLLDEFFWFWPQEESGVKFEDEKDEEEVAPPADEALRMLEESKPLEAARLFQERESKGSVAALHNLAVLHHLTALDFELCSHSESLSDADQAARDHAWRECYPRWQKLLDDPATWDRVRERISELDDPRLTHDLVGQIRESLEEVVLLINARLAVRAMEEGDSAGTMRQVRMMRGQGMSDVRASDALRRCLWPIDMRIRNAALRADQRSDVEPSAGLRIAEELLTETLPNLRLISQMLPADDSMREGLHDEVAKMALRSLTGYANKTDDWRAMKTILPRLLTELSPGEAMRARIEESLRVVTENVKFGQCFYCENHQSVDTCAHEVPMYGDVQTTWTGYKTYQINWKHLKVKVPRCPKCLANHNGLEDARVMGGVIGFALSALAATIGFFVWKPNDFHIAFEYVVGTLGTVVGTIVVTYIASELGAWVGFNRLEYKMRDVGEVDGYSSIATLRSQGWLFGSEPPE